MSEPSIRCSGVSKVFRVPQSEHATLRGRILHPRSRTHMHELHVLDDVSFEVRQGEFFGIVGRNGSGKSTLLKLLAGIYRADSGTVTVSGTLAPFIELGVGFNEDLSARDNVFVNGAILGMNRRQIEERLPHIVEFAELEGFMDSKLRNFSSGMLMRLAFAIAVQADADVLLVDEVLAVGDERFQRKCQDVFRARRQRGQTVVFVSHDMTAVEAFCDRALVLDQGRIAAIGDTADVVPVYHRLNRDEDDEADVRWEPEAEPEVDAEPDAEVEAAVDDLLGGAERPRGKNWITLRWLQDVELRRVQLDSGEAMRLAGRVRIPKILSAPRVRLLFLNEAGGVVGEITYDVVEDGAVDEHAGVNARAWNVDLTVENVLAAGRYRIVAELHATVTHLEQPVLADSHELEVDVVGASSVGSTRFPFHGTSSFAGAEVPA